MLVARAAGRPLDVVFQERIFEPLGMSDTDEDPGSAAVSLQDRLVDQIDEALVGGGAGAPLQLIRASAR